MVCPENNTGKQLRLFSLPVTKCSVNVNVICNIAENNEKSVKIMSVWSTTDFVNKPMTESVSKQCTTTQK